MKRAPGFISTLAAGLALALVYFALMYVIGGVYWCGDPTAFNPLAPPVGECRR